MDEIAVYATAGYDEREELRVMSQRGSCGAIKDGVVFSHGLTGLPSKGCWVLSFADLETIYINAKRARVGGA